MSAHDSPVTSDRPTWWSDPVVNLADQFSVLWELILWYTAVPISGFSLKRTDGGWLLVVNARSASRGALVCFTGGATAADCVAEFVAKCGTKDGPGWRADKYAK